MSTTDTATLEATPRSELAAKRDRELLERHKPRACLGRLMHSIGGLTYPREPVTASRIVVGAPRVRGTPVLILLPASSAKPTVYGSSFNALRQHSTAARAREQLK